MCYGSGCENELSSGPNIGECSGRGFCPPLGEICNVCGADTESDETICEQCKEIFEKEEL